MYLCRDLTKALITCFTCLTCILPLLVFHMIHLSMCPNSLVLFRPQKLIMYDKNVCIMHSATLSVISPYIVPHHIWTMHYTNGFPSNEKIQKRSIVALLFFLLQMCSYVFKQ